MLCTIIKLDLYLFCYIMVKDVKIYKIIYIKEKIYEYRFITKGIYKGESK